ncbi:MAG: VanW family protein [Clostridia bacterium]|nr:VanW family protein [Clostridia bacterium]
MNRDTSDRKRSRRGDTNNFKAQVGRKRDDEPAVKAAEPEVEKIEKVAKEVNTKERNIRHGSENGGSKKTKHMLIMLFVDIVLGLLAAAGCYFLSSGVTDVKTLLLYTGMLVLVAVIFHVIIDLILKKAANKDEHYISADAATLVMYGAALLIIVLCTVGAFAKIINDNLHHDSIYDGVYLDDIDVSGMTYEQALQIAAEKVDQQLASANFTLHIDDNSYNMNALTLGMSSNINDQLLAAYNYARQGSVLKRLDQVFRLRAQPENFPVSFIADNASIENIANSISSEIYSEVKDATMEFTPWAAEDFTYTAETVGKYIDPKAIIDAVTQNCAVLQFGDIYLSSEITQPSATLEELKKGTVLLSTFTTHLEDDRDRTSNVDLASTLIEGVVMPGEVFSFNGRTGERTVAAGFKSAHAIANGTELVESIAGGVCQAASTLHAALLTTDIKVVERHNHSFKVAYLSAGMDATVDYYMPLDFKFENVSGYPMYISCYVTDNEPDEYGVVDNTLTVNVYGTNIHPEREIVVRVETLETYAGGFNKEYTSKLPAGTEKYTTARVSGRKTNTYLDIYVNGELTDTILLYEEDIYHSVNGTILVGTG